MQTQVVSRQGNALFWNHGWELRYVLLHLIAAPHVLSQMHDSILPGHRFRFVQPSADTQDCMTTEGNGLWNTVRFHADGQGRVISLQTDMSFGVVYSKR